MIITQFQLSHFRNLTQLSIAPSADFNFIIGENGSGKSSLLEGIYLLSHGKAYRHHLNKKIIQYHQTQATAFAKITDFKQAHQIGLTKFLNKENQIKIDGKIGGKQTYLAHYLPIQLITPETFSLLTEGPKMRRSYLDWGCFHQFSDFTAIWHQVNRLTKQRNALLKSTNSNALFQYWDSQLIIATDQLTQFRRNYLQELTIYLKKALAVFFPELNIDIDFYAGWNQNKTYEAALLQHFEQDKIVGHTLVGAHKADLKLTVDGVFVEDRFSRGQLKLLMCALKLAQGEFYSAAKNQPCIYLIDDLPSELDQHNQKRLFDYLRPLKAQVFITALEAAAINAFKLEKDKIFLIKSGIID